MRLEAHAVDLNALGLDAGDNFAHGSVLGAGALDVVVVEDQLDVGTDGLGGGGGELEGKGNVLRANVLIKDVRSVGSIVTASMSAATSSKEGQRNTLERLIDDIPAVARTAVVLHSLGDVVLHGRLEGGIGPRRAWAGNPIGQL